MLTSTQLLTNEIEEKRKILITIIEREEDELEEIPEVYLGPCQHGTFFVKLVNGFEPPEAILSQVKWLFPSHLTSINFTIIEPMLKKMHTLKILQAGNCFSTRQMLLINP